MSTETTTPAAETTTTTPAAETTTTTTTPAVATTTTTPAETTTTTPAAAATTTEPAWREQIVDADMKKIAERFNSPNDLVKSFKETRDALTQSVRVPDEKATPEDKAKFFKAIGVPEDVKGYKITAPEGIEMTEADNTILAAVLPVALSSGIPAKAMNEFVGKFLEVSREFQNQAVKKMTEFGQQSEASLKKEWGGDFEANLNIANRTAEVVGGPTFKAFLNETPLASGGMLGDHPVMVKFLATQGRRMDEGDLMIGSTAQERTSIQTQIDALNKAVPVGSPGYTDSGHQAKLQGLFDQMHGRVQIVGSQGRAA